MTGTERVKATRAGISWLALFGAAALVAPSSAGAHASTGTVAVDYRADLFALPDPQRQVVAARIYDSDSAVRITVAPGHTVVVIGYHGERFARVTPDGVEVNASAPTAGEAGLLTQLPVHSVGWHRVHAGRTVTWHDSRLRVPPDAGDDLRWRIPLVIDGRPSRLEGDVRRIPAPAWWPWLVVGLPFLLVALSILVWRRSAMRTAAAAFGLVAAGGALASSAGFAVDTYGSSGKWVGFADALVFVLVGSAVIARASPDTRGIAGGALGLLALWAGLTAIPVLLHGVVLSVFPAIEARALVAVTLWAAATATALGVGVLFDHEPAERQDALRI